MVEEKQLQQRIFGLDLVRAAAIIFVVFSHLFYVIDSYNPTFISLSGLFGYFGVEVFFVLSGFLIGTILLKNYVNETFCFSDIKRFLIRRWFRTLPAYYLVLLLNIIIAVLFQYDYSSWWKYLFFIQNFSNYNITFFKESWSLSVEEWTYILMPIVLFFAFNRIKIAKKYSFIFLVGLLIVFFHLLRFYAYKTLNIVEMDVWNTEIKSTVIYRIDAILIGFVVAWLHYFYKSVLYKYRVYLLIITAHLFFFQFVVLNVLGVTLVTHPLYFKVFYFTFTSIIVALAMPFFINWKTTYKVLTKPIELISKISYSMYLLHYSIIAVLFKYFNFQVESILLLIGYIFTTTIFSYLMYRFYEKPMTDLRNRF